MSIFNRAYLYIIRKKVRSSILFLIVTLISFFLLSGSVLNTTVNNISKNLYKDVNFGFNIESADKSNKEIEKDTSIKISKQIRYSKLCNEPLCSRWYFKTRNSCL